MPLLPRSLLFPLILLLCASPCLGAAKASIPVPPEDPYAPFWRHPVMSTEALCFLRETPTALPCAQLFFLPKKVLSVVRATKEVSYEEGRDFKVDAATRSLCLPPGSRIPSLATELLPKPTAGFAVAPPGSGIGTFFHTQQVLVTYTHDELWSGPPIAGSLPQLVQKLEIGAPLKIVVLGDFMSLGRTASREVHVPPFQPSFPELFTEGIERRFRSLSLLTNLAAAQGDIGWAQSMARLSVATQPDLLLLAFGLSDVSRGTEPDKYGASLRNVLRIVHEAAPRTEILILTPVLPHPDWVAAGADRLTKYRDESMTHAAEGVAVADATSLWRELLARKGYPSLAGDGSSQPNDFGHRVLAQLLGGVLTDRKVATK